MSMDPPDDLGQADDQSDPLSALSEAAAEGRRGGPGSSIIARLPTPYGPAYGRADGGVSLRLDVRTGSGGGVDGRGDRRMGDHFS